MAAVVPVRMVVKVQVVVKVRMVVKVQAAVKVLVASKAVPQETAVKVCRPVRRVTPGVRPPAAVQAAVAAAQRLPAPGTGRAERRPRPTTSPTAATALFQKMYARTEANRAI